jgi:hemerythrin-like domain-containing protein
MGEIIQKKFAKFVEFSVDEMHHTSQQLLYCKRMKKKFEETGSIMNSKLPVRYRTGRSLDNVASMSKSAA